MLYFPNPQTEPLLSTTSKAALNSMSMHGGSIAECLGHSNIKNIFLIQDAYEAGHLNYLSEFLEKNDYGVLKAIVGEALYPDVFYLGSFYNPDYFDMQMLDSHGMQTLFSRLKPNVDASSALCSLLKEGTNFTDCRAMAMMARMLTIWDFCIHMHGEQAGTALFNQTYGEASANTSTPEVRRLLFSQIAEFSGLVSISFPGKSQSSSQFPINPLSCFVGYQHATKSTSALDIESHIGNAFFFANHPDYLIKHPAGAWAGFDMFYCGKGKFSGFGLKKGMRFLSRAEICKLFIEAYQQPHSRYALSFMRKISRPKRSCKDSLTAADIPMHAHSKPCTFRLNILDMFCQSDLSSYYPSIEAFIAQPSSTQLNLLKVQIALSKLKLETEPVAHEETHTNSATLLPTYTQDSASSSASTSTYRSTKPQPSAETEAQQTNRRYSW